jgi:serine/threonine-protein kinase
LIGNYEVLDRLGVGTMGRVYKARHRRLNRLVALKVLPSQLGDKPEAVRRFQREVKRSLAWRTRTS